MSGHKSKKKGSNIICRVSNVTPEMVCNYVGRMPKQQMKVEQFRDVMGKSWFQNEHQAPEQWGLYYIDGIYYYPRFDHDITIEEAEIYLYHWMRKLIVINPYTRFKKKCDANLVESIVRQLEINPNIHDLKTIISNIIDSDEPFIVNEIIANAINNYSRVLEVKIINKNNEQFNVSLRSNYKELLNIQNSMTKKEYFELFNVSKNINAPLQQIYYGAPGTGKSHTIDGIVNEDNSIRTTFHPDSDYATFVGAYKPTMENVKMSTILGEEVGYVKAKEGHPGTEQKIVYKYVPQAFLKAYVNAWNCYSPNQDNPYFLVIEEINRGNCAQIFGDLFQLLDRNNQGASSYSIEADDDIRKFLLEDEKGFKGLSEDQKDIIKGFKLHKDNGYIEELGDKILSGTKLLLPPNFRIWATMNTSDQSLFPIDSAFKRRWDWKYIPIDYKPNDKNGSPLNWQFKIKDEVYSWGKFLELINPIIDKITLSSDKQMGYFFAKAVNKGVISEETFLNKVLFYLWTDVFKDYDISAYEIFKNNKENRSFRFTDFFDDNEALGNFIKNLKLNEQDKDKVENQENKDSE